MVTLVVESLLQFSRRPVLFYEEIHLTKLINTGVALPSDVHFLLREAARGIQQLKGGRVSVSRLLTNLVRRHEDELRKLASGPRN